MHLKNISFQLNKRLLFCFFSCIVCLKKKNFFVYILFCCFFKNKMKDILISVKGLVDLRDDVNGEGEVRLLDYVHRLA